MKWFAFLRIRVLNTIAYIPPGAERNRFCVENIYNNLSVKVPKKYLKYRKQTLKRPHEFVLGLAPCFFLLREVLLIAIL